MNKKRKQETILFTSILQDVYNKLGNILDDEQDYLDNIPDNLKNGVAADRSQDYIDDLTEALDYLETAIDLLKNNH